jgi:hypothetical protein
MDRLRERFAEMSKAFVIGDARLSFYLLTRISREYSEMVKK